MPLIYRTIPNSSTWLRDTDPPTQHASLPSAFSLTGTDRSHDIRLRRIDTLIHVYEQMEDVGSQLYVASDLYFVLENWLKGVDTHQKGLCKEAERVEAVKALYLCVVQRLCVGFGCDAARLVNELELYFGRALGFYGFKLDRVFDGAKYFQRAEVAKYRLHFSTDGRVTQHPWWIPPEANPPTFVRADTSHASDPTAFIQHAGVDRIDWAGFVMTMHREMYVAKHQHAGPAGERTHFFHSSYLGLSKVMCAGTIKIVNGRVVGIATDSGHYRPTSQHMVSVLLAFLMFGINISQIEVQDFRGQKIGMAPEFLQANGNWEAMAKRRLKNIAGHAVFMRQSMDFDESVLRDWEAHCAHATYLTNNDADRRKFAEDFHKQQKRTRDGRLVTPYAGANVGYIFDALKRAERRDKNDKRDVVFRIWTDFLKNPTIEIDDTLRQAFLEDEEVVNHPLLRGMAGQQIWQTLKLAYHSYNLPWE